jgi:dihydroflavonol-4-reductase
MAGDVLDAGSVSRAMDGVDAVIHTAGRVSARARDDAVYKVNVDGTRNVLNAAFSRGARAVHTSSIATIGISTNPVIFNEEARPTAPPARIGYIESKHAAEDIARSLARGGLDVVTLNPGVLLGPGDVSFTSTRLVLDYLRGLLRFYPRGGISVCDARDVAAAHVAALTAGRRGERYIVAGENITYAELFARLWRLTGLHRPAPIPWPWAETMAFYADATSMLGPHPFEEAIASLRYGQLFNFCDSRKATRELGYQARDLSETLRDTIADEITRGAAQAVTPELRALAR